MTLEKYRPGHFVCMLPQRIHIPSTSKRSWKIVCPQTSWPSFVMTSWSYWIITRNNTRTSYFASWAKQTVARQACFFLIQGLIHHGNIATVTKQRAFNKAMITSFTEVIFIDEASESTLDIGNWKVLMQGGILCAWCKVPDRKSLPQQVPHDNHRPA